MDFVVSNGKIIEIAPTLSPKPSDTIIEGNNLILCTALIDINAHSGEPNRTEAESLTTLQAAAAAGGYAYIAHQPSRHAPIEEKSMVAYLRAQNVNHTCQILPIGSIVKSADKTKLANVLEMKEAGAVAFSTGNDQTLTVDILSNALQYLKGFGAKLMLHPEKKELSKNGQINQGVMSIQMGFKGIPREAETMAVEEIFPILSYNDAEALIMNISTSDSIEKIKKHNQKKHQITTAVSSLHLSLDQSELVDYDTSYKLSPPLRSKKDVAALQKAALDGDIDIIYSQHTPCTPEEKMLEFDHADEGATNLQTAFLATVQALGLDHIERCIEMMSTRPAAYLGIELPPFGEGVLGSYTLVDIGDKTVFTPATNLSNSVNSPYFHREFQGKIKAVISNQQIFVTP